MTARPKVTVTPPHRAQVSPQRTPPASAPPKKGSILKKCLAIIGQDIRDVIHGHNGEWAEYKRFCEIARGGKKV